jgi:hypothetical protein
VGEGIPDGGSDAAGGKAGGGAAAPSDWRLLFTHPLLRRALLVSSGLACVCAVVFFVAGLASDALQARAGGGAAGAARAARGARYP